MGTTQSDHASGLNDTVVVTRRVGWRPIVAMPLLFGAGLVLLAGLGMVGAELLFHRHVVPAPWWIVAALAGVSGVLLSILGTALLRSAQTYEVKTQRLNSASITFYLGFAIGLVVSADTSWRVFGEKFGIVGVERIFAFAGLEVMLLAAGFGMRRSMLSTGRPGSMRLLMWGLLAISTALSSSLAGWPIGLLRVLAGPVLAVVGLHYALGVERREREASSAVKDAAESRFGRVIQELQERLISLFGVADDARSALTRTRQRAADRAARLIVNGPAANATKALWVRRTRRALNQAGAVDDLAQIDRVLAGIALNRSVHELHTLEVMSPWASRAAQLSASYDEKSAATAMSWEAFPDQTPTIPPGLVGHLPDQPDLTDQYPTTAASKASTPQVSPWSDTSDQSDSPAPAPSRPEYAGSLTQSTSRGLVGSIPSASTSSTSGVPGWSGTGSAAPQLVSDEQSGSTATNGSGAGIELVDGKVQTLKTKGKSNEAIADLLEPITQALMAEHDFLSRQDVVDLTETNSSTTAGQIQKILKDRYPDHPAPTGRRKPDRNRTITQAFIKLTGGTPLKSVR